VHNFLKFNEDDLSKFKAEILNAKTADQRQKLQPKKTVRAYLNNPKQLLTQLRMNPAEAQEMLGFEAVCDE